MTLTGKDAEDFANATRRKHEQAAKERLEAAKTEAKNRGKEPFDLKKLETLVDPGRMIGATERERTYEYMYYVEHPKFSSLQELADLIMELSEY
ncbi:MAG: hypothetical protein JO257_12500 [Deltaproteobacteria bacterium]|nr:hypothetical protein [Deltaproteobacteria bacterium]